MWVGKFGDLFWLLLQSEESTPYDSVVLKVELVFCRLKMIKLKSWINLLVTGCLFREVFLSCILFLASF